MLKSKNNLLLILTIIFAFLFFITYYKVNLLMYDDAFYACILKPYETNFVLNNFILNTAVEHFQLIAVFLSKFIGTILPNMLGYHPQDFILKFGHLIKGILYIFSIIILTCFVFMKKSKNTVLFSGVFFFLFFSVLMIIMQNARDTFALYSSFFRFQMPLIYMFSFLTLALSNYIDKSFKYKNWLIFLYVLNIVDGNEITIFVVQLFVFLLIAKLGFKYCKTNKLLTSLFLLLPTIKLFLTTLTNKYKGDLFSNFSFELFCDYIYNYLKFVFYDNFLFFALFFSALLLFKFKEKDKSIIAFATSISVSILVFLFLLIVYGKVCVVEGQPDIYLLNHWHIKSTINIILFTLSIFLFIRIFKNQKILAAILFALSFSLIYISAYVYPQIYTFRKSGHLYLERDDMYKFEKEVLTQASKYNGSVYLSYMPSKKLEVFGADYDMFYFYFVSTYKINPENLRFIYVSKEEAAQKLRETGISFEVDEIKHPKFESLYKIN